METEQRPTGRRPPRRDAAKHRRRDRGGAPIVRERVAFPGSRGKGADRDRNTIAPPQAPPAASDVAGSTPLCPTPSRGDENHPARRRTTHTSAVTGVGGFIGWRLRRGRTSHHFAGLLLVNPIRHQPGSAVPVPAPVPVPECFGWWCRTTKRNRARLLEMLLGEGRHRAAWARSRIGDGDGDGNGDVLILNLQPMRWVSLELAAC